MSALVKNYYNNDAFSRHFSFCRKFDYDFEAVRAANKGKSFTYITFNTEYSFSKLALFIISAIATVASAPSCSILGVVVTIVGLTSTLLIGISTIRDILTCNTSSSNLKRQNNTFLGY
jgi:hypothetical protein